MSKAALVTSDFYSALPFWGKLERDEQSTVKKETEALAAAHAGQVAHRVEMGEHLTNLQAVLDGKNLFLAYLKSLNFSYRTAYRYIEAYKAVKAQLPDYALRLAAARGIDLVGYAGDRPFGPYTDPIKKLPPPKEVEAVPEWLDRIEEARKAAPRPRAKGTASPQNTLKRAFRAVSTHYNRMPSGKARTQWAVKLLGILMAEFGLPAQTLQPEAVPEGFRAVLGRPKGKGEAA
jgi:hypothetical protein